MFVSAGVDLQLHSFSSEGVETYEVQQPSSKSRITCVSICNDNSYIVVLRENEKPQIFSAKDLKNVRLVHTINVSNVSTITFKHNTKKNIAMGSLSGDVILYDTKVRTVSNIYQKITERVQNLDFTCDDHQLCGFDGDIFFVFPEINNNKDLKRYKQKSKCCFLKCHPFIPDRVAVGCTNGHVGLWDVKNGNELIHLEVLNSPVSGLVMSSCGNFVIVSGKDLKICSLDFNSGICNFQQKINQEKSVSCIDLSPDDKFLAVGSTDGNLKLLDVKLQFKEVFSSRIQNTPINIITFENRAREINSNFSSIMKLADESENAEVCSKTTISKTKTPKSVKLVDPRDDSMEKFKRSMFKIIKTEMDSLENQFSEHCSKFQKFLDNEFETIDGIMKKKWDIFNVGDMNQILKAIFPDEAKSSCDS